MTIRSHKCEDNLWHGKIEEIYGNLAKMTLKYLEFDWSRYSRTEDCVLGQFLLTLMARSMTLEYLYIKDIPRAVRLEVEGGKDKQEFQLPKLKIFQHRDPLFESPRYSDENVWLNLLRIVCSRAPNLEELKSKVTAD